MTTDSKPSVIPRTLHPETRDPYIPAEREPGEEVARVRLGSYEFEKKGVSRFDLRDPYHLAVALTWPQFFAAMLALYLSVNVVFATLYWLFPGSVANARPGSFADVFFFSIETLATVGYGEMYPAMLYSHVVVAFEIVCGFAFTAILTGLTFVRFSRPRAKLVFAANPVVAVHRTKPTLMVRIGNGRGGVLTDVAAKLNIFFFDTTTEGMRLRRSQELVPEVGNSRSAHWFYPGLWPRIRDLAALTTCSGVKPNSRITISPGADPPKRSSPMIVPSRPT